MRSVLLCLSALLILAPASGAQAQSAPAEPATIAAPPSLDKLLADLKREPKEHAAKRIADRIAERWRHSGSESVDLLMLWAADATKAKKFGVALDFLDRVTVLQPDFSEGWNRRATVHFMMKNYALSMADIERALRLEPRHFGALSGMAQIFKDTGSKALALKAYERLLEVYPMMRSAQNEVATLSEELAGQAI
ncbi:MAG: hypothetical protein WBA44_03990 [Mesorhizobium sp.]